MPSKTSDAEVVALDPVGLDPLRDDPGPGAEHIARYQGRSGRLSPSARPDGAEVTTRVSSTGAAPILVAWVPSVRIQRGAEVAILAAVVDEQGAPVAARAVVAVARRGQTAVVERPLVAAAAGADHALESRFPAPDVDARDPEPSAFEYAVRAEGTFHGEPFVRVATGAFFVHAPGGKLDLASARTERQAGDLALLLESRIERAGTYWAYAELWGGESGGTPIAFARDRFERVQQGLQRFSLHFGGQVIRDAAIDGPYVVRTVRFQQVDAFPPSEADPIRALPPTPAWKATDFH